MKREIEGKGLPHGITAFAFIVFVVLGLACASTPVNLEELTTYSEVIELTGLSQDDVFLKVQNAFSGFSNTRIQSADQSTNIIKGLLVVDGIIHGNQRLRYNSIFTVEISEEVYKITFTNPTIQDIGFTSELEKELAFQSYLTGRRAVSALTSSITSNIQRPSNSQVNLTPEQIRAEWEKENVFSSTNPGPERAVRYDYQIENVRKQWIELTNLLKNSITVN